MYILYILFIGIRTLYVYTRVASRVCVTAAGGKRRRLDGSVASSSGRQAAEARWKCGKQQRAASGGG